MEHNKAMMNEPCYNNNTAEISYKAYTVVRNAPRVDELFVRPQSKLCLMQWYVAANSGFVNMQA